jgi:hypothetical protein
MPLSNLRPTTAIVKPAPMLVHAVDRSDAPSLTMPARFRHEIAYFMTPGGAPGVPALAPGEYWVRLADAQECLEAGVVRIVSPLDTATRAEIELSEEQEAWLEWMVKYRIEHIRLEG